MGTVDTDADTLAPRDEGTQRRVAMLEKLAGIGMTICFTFQEQATIELARDMQVQADWTPETGSTRVAPSELPKAYDVVSLSMRRTLALANKLEAGLKARAARARVEDAEDEDAAPGPDPADEPAPQLARIYKKVIRRALEEAIEAEAPEDRSENLLTDLYERLDDLSDDADVADVPIYQLLEGVCRDLGLTADACERVGQAWGAEAAPDARLAEYGPAVVRAAFQSLEIQKQEIRAALAAQPPDGPGPGEHVPRRPRRR